MKELGNWVKIRAGWSKEKQGRKVSHNGARKRRASARAREGSIGTCRRSGVKRDGEGDKVIPYTPVCPRLREVVEMSCYIPQVIFSLDSAFSLSTLISMTQCHLHNIF